MTRVFSSTQTNLHNTMTRVDQAVARIPSLSNRLSYAVRKIHTIKGTQSNREVSSLSPLAWPLPPSPGSNPVSIFCCRGNHCCALCCCCPAVRVCPSPCPLLFLLRFGGSKTVPCSAAPGKVRCRRMEVEGVVDVEGGLVLVARTQKGPRRHGGPGRVAAEGIFSIISVPAVPRPHPHRMQTCALSWSSSGKNGTAWMLSCS